MSDAAGERRYSAFFDGWLWSGGGSGSCVNGVLRFHGLQIDQVCKQDALGDLASFRDDV